MSRSILRQDAQPETRPAPVAIAVAPRSRSITRQLPALHAGAVALVLFVLALLVFTAGCRNPFTIYQHRHTGLDFHGEPDIAYYHYPRGGWFVPSQQTHHCPTMVEAPFHGFQPTCWTQWPEPYCPCPPPSSVQPIHGEVIEAPAHDAPQPMTQPSSEPTPAPLINDEARTAPAPISPPAMVMPKPASEAPRSSEPIVIAAPTVAVPEVSTPPVAGTSSAPSLKFHGKHGFSQADDGGPQAAVAIELPTRAEDKSESNEEISADYPLQQLRKRMQPASETSPTTAKKTKNKVAVR